MYAIIVNLLWNSWFCRNHRQRRTKKRAIYLGKRFCCI